MNADLDLCESARLRDGLRNCVKEFRIRAYMDQIRGQHASMEMAQSSAVVCDEAAVMLQKLEGEVARLRYAVMR